MEVLGFLPYSSNHTFLARCRTATSEVLAVYKPARGERPLWDFGQGSLYRRELAAYLDLAGCEGEAREQALALAPQGPDAYTAVLGWYLLERRLP